MCRWGGTRRGDRLLPGRGAARVHPPAARGDSRAVASRRRVPLRVARIHRTWRHRDRQDGDGFAGLSGLRHLGASGDQARARSDARCSDWTARARRRKRDGLAAREVVSPRPPVLVYRRMGASAARSAARRRWPAARSTASEFEGERVVARPIVYITFNTGPEGLRVLDPAYVRRSVVLYTSTLRRCSTISTGGCGASRAVRWRSRDFTSTGSARPRRRCQTICGSCCGLSCARA